MSAAAAAQLLDSKYDTSVPNPQIEPIWNVISTMTFCTLQQIESKFETQRRPSAAASAYVTANSASTFPCVRHEVPAYTAEYDTPGNTRSKMALFASMLKPIPTVRLCTVSQYAHNRLPSCAAIKASALHPAIALLSLRTVEFRVPSNGAEASACSTTPARSARDAGRRIALIS